MAVFGNTFFQGVQRVTLPRLYFYGRDIVPACNHGFAYKEVYLHAVFGRRARTVAEKIQLVSGGAEHLRNYVFNQHTLVYFKFVEHQLAVKVGAYNATFVKSMAYEKPRVAHVTFQRGTLFVKFKPYARFGRIITAVDNTCVVQPKERLRIIAHARLAFQSREHELLFVFLQLAGHSDHPDRAAKRQCPSL